MRAAVRLALCGGSAAALVVSGPLSSRSALAKSRPPVQNATFAWGYNVYGQLGVGTEKDAAVPTLVEALEGLNIVRVSASGSSFTSAALSADGRVYTFGYGADDRLGHGHARDAPNQVTPRQVDALASEMVMDVSVGEYHMAALTAHGKVYTWGRGVGGALGHKSLKPGLPEPVESLDKEHIVAVSCGRQHTVALAKDGRVFSWGGAFYGATGHPEDKKTNTLTPKQIMGDLAREKVVQVVCGRDHTLFLTDKGDVWGCGSDDMGQLGEGRSRRYQYSPVRIVGLEGKGVARIVAGANHSIAICADGSVYTWGSGMDGQLGHGVYTDEVIPRLLTGLEPEDVVVDAAAGGGHTLLVTSNRKLLAFGRGRYGQLGRSLHLESVAAKRPSPLCVELFNGKKINGVACGRDHSLALVEA